jgi:hypothetical protein
MKILTTAAICVLCAACSSPKPKPESPAASPVGEVKITQFYTGASQITPGEKSTICYGVENAKSVSLKPEVEKLWPAFSRCFEVSPQRSTRYTLTAEGFGARSVTASFEIQVVGRAAAAAPAQASGPLIHKFELKPKEPGEDKPPTICYLVDNADAVEIAPNVLPLSGVLQGCFYVNPKVSTTYTLTAHGTGGKKSMKQLTIAAQ